MRAESLPSPSVGLCRGYKIIPGAEKVSGELFFIIRVWDYLLNPHHRRVGLMQRSTGILHTACELSVELAETSCAGDQLAKGARW